MRGIAFFERDERSFNCAIYNSDSHCPFLLWEKKFSVATTW
ncbi:hypothetical protein RIEGSTA812A_PEG_1204 [invertebrate metagenome]|uniref:Uncharacterized protein n=1 Tax=invertebrate metagenome TaxID=1711999 RepID=A0A484H810_9ZZZZ